MTAQRLLVVSYFYSPAVHPRSFRWTAIAARWAAAGHHVDVVCAGSPGEPRSECLDGVNVHRAGTSLRGLLLRRKTAQGTAGAVDPAKGGGAGAWWLRLAFALHRRTWKRLYWPDYACLWLFPALVAVRRLARRCDYDAVITVSWPFTDHLIGLLARRWLADRPWIVDLGDPFASGAYLDTNNERLYGRLNRAVERRVVEQARSVCIPTRAMLAAYAAAYPAAAQRLRYVPHLAPRPALEDASTTPAVQPPGLGERALRLLFAGNLSPNGVRPDFCLEVFAAAARGPLAGRVALHFFGNSLPVEASFRDYRDLDGTALFRRPSEPHRRILATMDVAEALVSIGSVSAMALPCKLIDYVSRGRPIIHFACNPDDPAREFLAGHHGALILLEHPGTSLAEHVARLVAFLEELPPRLTERQSAALLRDHSIETVAAHYLAAVPGVASARSPLARKTTSCAAPPLPS